MEILEGAHAYIESFMLDQAIRKITSEYYVEPIELHKFIISMLNKFNMNTIPVMMKELGYSMKIKCTFEKIQL